MVETSSDISATELDRSWCATRWTTLAFVATIVLLVGVAVAIELRAPYVAVGFLIAYVLFVVGGLVTWCLRDHGRRALVVAAPSA
jgi:hypothetical protein